MVTKKDVFRMLEDFHIGHDCKITVHSSLRSVGEIQDGAQGLIDAFCEYLSQGLLLVPTHTWRDVNEDNPYYDVKKTVPCIGTLAKVAAFHPHGERSLHPTHSLAAFGKGAAEYIRGEELSSTPAPVGGCLNRLYEEKGKILLIGVSHNRNTYLHAVEERLGIPNRLNPDSFVVTIRDAQGRLIQSPPFHSHLISGLSEHYMKYQKAFEYTKAVSYGTLGNAVVTCCDAVKMADTVALLWKHADYDLCLEDREIPEAYYSRLP